MTLASLLIEIHPWFLGSKSRLLQTLTLTFISFQLRKSHILPPISKTGYFNTTHNDTFTPKRTEKHSYDAGRLQKSSVPLGTLTPAVEWYHDVIIKISKNIIIIELELELGVRKKCAFGCIWQFKAQSQVFRWKIPCVIIVFSPLCIKLLIAIFVLYCFHNWLLLINHM